MSTQNNTTSGGIGFASLLTLIFITLKLLGKIDWSWWWVLMPTLITFGICLLVVLVVLMIVAAGTGLRERRFGGK